MKKVTASIVDGNDAPVSDAANWRASANAFTVTLRYDGRTMTLPFWTGSGWTTNPTAADVLENLCSTASMVANARDFEDFAAEIGADADSRRAERDYRASVDQTDELRALLGDDFDAIVFADEDAIRSRCA